MIDKEVALVSVVFLFVLLGIYIFVFQGAEAESILKPVQCTANPAQSEIILPPPNTSQVFFEDALKGRRSVREFSGEYLTLEEVSALLWAGQGITDQSSGFRTAPSAGALYPMELYLVPNRVQGAECGIYHYIPQEHKLVLVKEGSFTEDMEKAAYGQSYVGDAAAVIVFTAVPARSSIKYGDQGAERYINMEAGHISENMLLQASALGLGAAPIGGFSQDFVDTVFGIDGEREKSVYLNIVGKKKE